jgi:hypothetical protein
MRNRQFENIVKGFLFVGNYNVLMSILRSRETQIIKAYKLVPAKLGCFVK